MDHEERLRHLVRGSRWLMDVLRTVRSLHLPDWVVGSGAIRNLVWDSLHGYTEPTPLNDIDVAYFDPSDVSRRRDHALEQRLDALLPGVPWEVTNQAGVHLWYETKFGHSIRPLTSTKDALATWPETATAVGVRLRDDEAIDVVAPLGLDDLFGLVLRRNDRQVTREFFRRRVEEKRMIDRWPKIVLLDD